MGFAAPAGHTPAMGVRTRGLDIAIGAKRQVADAAARAEAKAVIERWNEQLAASRDMLVAHDPGRADRRDALARRVLPWLRHEPGNRSAEGRSPSARVSRNARAGTAVLVVPGIGTMPRILGLHALPPAAKAAASNLCPRG